MVIRASRGPSSGPGPFADSWGLFPSGDPSSYMYNGVGSWISTAGTQSPPAQWLWATHGPKSPPSPLAQTLPQDQCPAEGWNLGLRAENGNSQQNSAGTQGSSKAADKRGGMGIPMPPPTPQASPDSKPHPSEEGRSCLRESWSKGSVGTYVVGLEASPPAHPHRAGSLLADNYCRCSLGAGTL